ncbi:MAG: SPFH domain-containing protein [Defluviitaleaceae bacterium]|nr:SPFH domain-containing protein [Defluviitaleaceae bacterium]
MGEIPLALTITVVVLGVLFLVILGMLSWWKKVPQDKALVVTGLKKRVISGGGGLVVPILERTDKISLENMKIIVNTQGALTAQGVDIIIAGVAVLKVKSDKESILAAIEQFNTGNENKTIQVIENISKDVLEGKLREIISKLTVEEIYKDREMFASQVQEVAALDLAEMGLEIKAFTIRDISDVNGYLEALGKRRISEVKRDALIAEAEAAKETKIRTSEAHRLGEEARLVAETQISEAAKTKELKIQSYKKEEQSAKAITDLAYEIESNKVKREVTETELQVEVIRQQKMAEITGAEMQVEVVRKQKEIEVAEQEVVRREKEMEAGIIKVADANKYQEAKSSEAINYRKVQEAQAASEAIRLEGTARADAKRLEGMAEVDVILARGKAEAEAMLKKAEAFKQYNDAAVTQMIVERLPEIASAVAAPLAKTEKIVVVDNGGGSGGGGASKIPGYVTDIISTLPHTVEALTGINVLDALKSKATPAEARVVEAEAAAN